MTAGTARRFTVVSFHAHPDDEALLTSGTLARAAAEGHRVVVVVATAGESGLAAGHPGTSELGRRRARELAVSARAIGAARTAILGYADSGWPAAADIEAPMFSALDPEVPAVRLAALLREERADVLTSYDAAGGYGHPDHVQVHRVARRAAQLAGTPVVLEATVDRGRIDRAVRLLRGLSHVVPLPDLPEPGSTYTARADLTHEIDVRRHLRAKRAALAAHASQAGRAGGDRRPRTVSLLLHLPRPLAGAVLGREWFREPGRTPAFPLEDDIFASLRPAAR